ncbi:MAG: helix-turn-helix transcriptional regulator [Bacteroidota bacterium]
MEIEKMIIVLLLALGSCQGIVYGVILFRSVTHNKVANRILAVLLFLLSYRLWVQIMRLFGLGYYDGWYYIMVDLSWIHGALIYFYTKAQTQPNFKFQRKDWVHFLPVMFQVCFSVFVRLQNLYWDGTRESLSWLGYWGYVIWMNNSTIYLVASSLIIYYAYRSLKVLRALDDSLEIVDVKLKWMQRILTSFLIYFSIILIILLIDLVVHNTVNEGAYYYFTRFYYYPFFIGIAILTYWICLEGFSRRNDPEIIPKTNPKPIDLKRLEGIAQQLEEVMEKEQLFKNQELTLQHLAEALKIKPYLVSKALSEVLNKRFSDYVNAYRVVEVQRLLKDPNKSHYTLLSLAMEAGFNSKSSFNRAIKKQLGISPSELKDLV